MRVLFVTPNYPSDVDPVGGSFYRTQATALARCGATVEIVSPVPWVPPGLALFSTRWKQYSATRFTYELDTIPVHRPRIVTHPRNLAWGFTHVLHARAVRNVAARFKPDVIHGHFAYPSGLAADNVARDLDVPAALTLHGGDVNALPLWSRTALRRVRRAILGADIVFSVSQALASRAHELFGRDPLVLPLGIDLERFRNQPERAEARSILGLPDVDFIALFVGWLSPTKGVPELVRATELLNGAVKCAFVGAGPLEALVTRGPNTLYFGTRPPSSIPLFMRAADVLVLPSHTEGMPTVLIEAGAARLPVIATPAGGIPELLGDGRGVLLPSSPATPEHIAKALAHARAEVRESRTCADRLFEYVSTRYDARLNATVLIQHYHALLYRRPHPASLHPAVYNRTNNHP